MKKKESRCRSIAEFCRWTRSCYLPWIDGSHYLRITRVGVHIPFGKLCSP